MREEHISNFTSIIKLLLQGCFCIYTRLPSPLLQAKCYLSRVTPHSSDERSQIRARFMIIKPSQDNFSLTTVVKSVGERDKLTA